MLTGRANRSRIVRISNHSGKNLCFSYCFNYWLSSCVTLPDSGYSRNLPCVTNCSNIVLTEAQRAQVNMRTLNTTRPTYLSFDDAQDMYPTLWTICPVSFFLVLLTCGHASWTGNIEYWDHINGGSPFFMTKKADHRDKGVAKMSDLRAKVKQWNAYTSLNTFAFPKIQNRSGTWSINRNQQLLGRTFHCPTYSGRNPGSPGSPGRNARIPGGFLVPYQDSHWIPGGVLVLPTRIPGTSYQDSWYFLSGFLVESW